MEVDRNILTEALSAVLGVKVKLQSDCKGLDGVIELSITRLAILYLLGHEAFKLTLQQPETLRSVIGRLLIGDHKNSQETPESESVSSSLRKEIFAIPDDFFAPEFDFDFTNMSESISDFVCERGDEPYKRPYGWMRFALKVRDKYPDGNAWLGTGGWRDRLVPGEWPVSYHGTGLNGAEMITQSHFKAGSQQAYGRGIYSSPDIEIANEYTTTKKFKSEKNGKTYKVIMQNRVNPKNRKIIVRKNYWLVPIPEGSSAEKEREIVESSIRPYGILLQEVKNGG